MKRMLFLISLVSISLMYAQPAKNQPMQSKVVKLQSPQELNKHLKSGKPTLLLFTTDNCGPCEVMKPVYHQLSNEHTDITFIGVHGGEPASSLRSQFGAQASPSLVIFDAQGKKVSTEVGGPMTAADARIDLGVSIAQAKGETIMQNGMQPMVLNNMPQQKPMQMQPMQPAPKQMNQNNQVSSKMMRQQQPRTPRTRNAH